ncbi:glycoside hydrolase family 99-like domain-containing protein [Ensifer aridi]|uniref:glycoside hydrolase family 99-like domain-containing protein n=1 Tax=Ensifer aridi TaxID=1708715 RepID=UPI0006153EEC|nr:glycoside hydrolase family 99-like domain-containing protein [Ensifer aridi]
MATDKLAVQMKKEIELRSVRGLASGLGLFDEVWYCEKYQDVSNSGLDPFIHYLEYGWLLGRKPSDSDLLRDVDWSVYDGKDEEHPFISFILDLIRKDSAHEQAYLDTLDHFEGSIDYITRARVSGWAWCPSATECSLWVEALIDDEIVGRARADLMRPDLLKSGKGTGRYGFTIDFNPILSGKKVPTVRVAHGSLVALPWTVNLTKWMAPGGAWIEPSAEALIKDHLYFTQPSPEYEDPTTDIIKSIPPENEPLKPIVLAYYLPQFHPIPENDTFWGKGFTDWRQLSRALPRFPGHYQPRIPRDLGYYELGNSNDVLRRQSAMALDAGVTAFCYYYYWFNGRRVLQRPLEAHLSSEIEMPFLIMWANENWTRTWDGFEADILLRQDYRIEEEDALLRDFARHFDDPRYLRLDHRPLFVIYNPGQIPNAATTIERWREKLRKKFFHDPLMFMAQTFDAESPEAFGVDGAIEFPPHKLAAAHPGRAMLDAYSLDFSGRVIEYTDIITSSLKEEVPTFPLIKTAVPGWDNDARRPNRGLILEGISPQKYETWVSLLVEKAIANPVYGKPIIGINAWNEWAEAAYLEPDLHFGAAFLNATARGIVSGVAKYVANKSMARI